MPGLAIACEVDNAVLVWVVHDTDPHARSPKIKNSLQVQHWFQDLTTIGVTAVVPAKSTTSR